MSHLNITLAPYKYHLEHCGLVMCQITRTGHLPTAANSEHFVNCNINCKTSNCWSGGCATQKKYGVSIIVSFIVVENSTMKSSTSFAEASWFHRATNALWCCVYIYILNCATDHNMYQFIIVFLKLYGIISNYIPWWSMTKVLPNIVNMRVLCFNNFQNIYIYNYIMCGRFWMMLGCPHFSKNHNNKRSTWPDLTLPPSSARR